MPDTTTDQPKDTIAKLTEAADNFDLALAAVQPFVGVLAPNILPFIVLGRLVDQQIPGIATTVQKWIGGTPPTDEEKAQLQQLISDLNYPERI